MRDSRFIELINLYIDRQITVDETAELEAEMQDNPRRRAIYRQYCQLHSATKQVYDRFRASADTPSLAPAGRSVLAEFSHQPRRNWVHYVGGLTAVAACLAFAVVRYNTGTQPAPELSARVEPKPAVQAVASAQVEPSAAPSLISLRHDPAADAAYSALLATLREDEQHSLGGTENRANRLPSLFDDGVFEVRPVLPANGQRTFRSKQTPAQQAEFTAFQFQR